MQETLYLLSIRGMRESIRKGLRTPLSKTSKTLKWRAGLSSSSTGPERRPRNSRPPVCPRPRCCWPCSRRILSERLRPTRSSSATWRRARTSSWVMPNSHVSIEDRYGIRSRNWRCASGPSSASTNPRSSGALGPSRPGQSARYHGDSVGSSLGTRRGTQKSPGTLASTEASSSGCQLTTSDRRRHRHGHHGRRRRRHDHRRHPSAPAPR